MNNVAVSVVTDRPTDPLAHAHQGLTSTNHCYALLIIHVHIGFYVRTFTYPEIFISVPVIILILALSFDTSHVG